MNELQQKKHLISNDEDFVDCQKFKNSLKKVIEKHPDGVEDEFIAKLLLMSNEELQLVYQNSIEKLRKMMS